MGKTEKWWIREPKAPPPDLSTLKKAELVELAEEQDIDASGTKADIIERLEEQPADG